MLVQKLYNKQLVPYYVCNKCLLMLIIIIIIVIKVIIEIIIVISPTPKFLLFLHG